MEGLIPLINCNYPPPQSIQLNGFVRSLGNEIQANIIRAAVQQKRRGGHAASGEDALTRTSSVMAVK